MKKLKKPNQLYMRRENNNYNKNTLKGILQVSAKPMKRDYFNLSKGESHLKKWNPLILVG